MIPERAGKLDGTEISVPTPEGSLVYLCVNLERETTREEVNAAVKEAFETYLKGCLK